MNSRRNFLKISALTGAASLITLDTPASEPKTAATLKLGLASYTLRKFTQAKAIAMTKRLDLDYMCFKSMHLPLSSTKQELENSAKRVAEAGLQLYAGGVIYMKTKAEVDQAFSYAKYAGMTTIVGVPGVDLLQYTNQKIKEYNIKVAIHNHGPGDEVYPSPESIYTKIKDLDPRFGICMDIGHTQRIGVDPIASGEKFFDRLLDVHVKDVDKATAEGTSVEAGRGVIDLPGFLKMLVDKNYQGVVGFEFEKDADDPLPGLAESVGYVRGCLDSI